MTLQMLSGKLGSSCSRPELGMAKQLATLEPNEEKLSYNSPTRKACFGLPNERSHARKVPILQSLKIDVLIFCPELFIEFCLKGLHRHGLNYFVM